MPTTTLKLPPDLKRRVASLVRGTDKSPHAFMVEAISSEIRRAELRRKFVRDAVASHEEMVRSGLGYDLAESKAYWEARLAGKRAKRPRLKRWRK